MCLYLSSMATDEGRVRRHSHFKWVNLWILDYWFQNVTEMVGHSSPSKQRKPAGRGGFQSSLTIWQAVLTEPLTTQTLNTWQNTIPCEIQTVKFSGAKATCMHSKHISLFLQSPLSTVKAQKRVMLILSVCKTQMSNPQVGKKVNSVFPFSSVRTLD